jgi:hypothetical protein
MLHVLAHMQLLGGTETSDTIALMLNTNPVVVHRTVGKLKQQGIVSSERAGLAFGGAEEPSLWVISSAGYRATGWSASRKYLPG